MSSNNLFLSYLGFSALYLKNKIQGHGKGINCMLTLKIEIESLDKTDLGLSLDFIKEEINKGFIVGQGWSLEGETEYN